jgi:hypothetical protein
MAEDWFGNDVAFSVTVAAGEHARMLALMSVDGSAGVCAIEDNALPATLVARFASYFEVKAWLETHGVPFATEFDNWA